MMLFLRIKGGGRDDCFRCVDNWYTCWSDNSIIGVHMKIEVDVYEADGIRQGQVVGIKAFYYQGRVYQCNGDFRNLGRDPAVFQDVKKMKVGSKFTVEDYFKNHPTGKYRSNGFQRGISKLIEKGVLLQVDKDTFQKVRNL